MEKQKYTFHIHGMHCKSCVLMIENELKENSNIEEVHASLKNNSVNIVGNFENQNESEIADWLTQQLKQYGYSASIEKQKHKAKWSEFKIALPIAVSFIILFILLQKIGIINLVNASEVTYGTAFLIGIIASLSTCMAVVGGLLLSMSASFAKEGDAVKPQILFHLGRLLSFFVLGGIIGMIGSFFTFTTTSTFLLSSFVAIVMFILGINLLDVFPWFKKIQPSMPKFIAKHAHGVSKLSHTLTPTLVGIATFFLPCGFTQAMQLYTLTTGEFLKGALTMFSFALGTFPVLALISFSSFSIQNKKKSGIFFKSAGLIVIIFALFNIINSLAIIGFISPIFNF